MIRSRRWALAMTTACVALGAGAQEPSSMPDPVSKVTERGGEVRGTVVKVDARVLYLARDGVIVRVEVDARTQFEGTRAKLKDYRPGDRVEVAVVTKDRTDNVARRIAIDESSRAGVGGSGVSPPAVEPTHPPKPLDAEPGTGGSGVMNYGAEKNTASNGAPATLADPAPGEP